MCVANDSTMGKQSMTEPGIDGKTSPKKAAAVKRGGAKASKKRSKLAATIEDAIEMAVEAHRGQTDKYGQPYILHVLGVAGRCRSIEEKIVAFLHDVVEDTDATFDDLRKQGFSERIITAVDALTRRNRESYDAFVERIAPNALARAVKLADLEDNMDIRRSNRPMKPKDAERLEKYRKAWQYLAALHTEGKDGLRS
jgi:(p)ppGpp synthase/HD superfamily hydrolase